MSLKDDNSFKLSIDSETTTLEHPLAMGARLTVSTERLAEEYFNSTKRDSGILPPVVRWASSDFTAFIIERPPTEVLLQYKDGMKNDLNGITEEFLINVPWTVVGISFTNTTYCKVGAFHIYARTSPIFSEDDVLYVLPLPNILPGGTICGVDLANKTLENLKGCSTATAINGVINSFWSSTFNKDTYTQMLKDEGAPDDFPDGASCKGTLKYLSSLSMDEVLNLGYKPSVITPYDEETGRLKKEDNGMYVKADLTVSLLASELSGDRYEIKATGNDQAFLDYIQPLVVKASQG